MPRLAGTGDRRHAAGAKIERVHHMAGDIGDEQTPFRGIEADIVRLDQSRLRDGADNSGSCIDAADAAVAPIDDEESAGAVERNAVGFIQAGSGCGAAIAGET